MAFSAGTVDSGGRAVPVGGQTMMPADQAVEELLGEVSLMQQLRHDHVVQFFGSAVKDGWVLIVMEYISGGSLASMLTQFGGRLPVLSVSRYVGHVVAGLEFLHAASIVHRDLKPGNILVTIEGQCKLADFGASAELTHAAAGEGGPVGTPHYMAPEAARGLGRSPSDIWSLGITQVELLTGSPPWPDISNVFGFVIKLGSTDPPQPQLPTKGSGVMSDDAVDFSERCCVREPEKRLSAKQLGTHPYLLGTS